MSSKQYTNTQTFYRFVFMFQLAMVLSITAMPLYFKAQNALSAYGMAYSAMAITGGFSFIYGQWVDKLGDTKALIVGTLLYAVALMLRLITHPIIAVMVAILAGIGACMALLAIQNWTARLSDNANSPKSQTSTTKLTATRRLITQSVTLIGTGLVSLLIAIFGDIYQAILLFAGFLAMGSVVVLPALSASLTLISLILTIKQTFKSSMLWIVKLKQFNIKASIQAFNTKRFIKTDNTKTVNNKTVNNKTVNNKTVNNKTNTTKADNKQSATQFNSTTNAYLAPLSLKQRWLSLNTPIAYLLLGYTLLIGIYTGLLKPYVMLLLVDYGISESQSVLVYFAMTATSMLIYMLIIRYNKPLQAIFIQGLLANELVAVIIYFVLGYALIAQLPVWLIIGLMLFRNISISIGSTFSEISEYQLIDKDKLVILLSFSQTLFLIGDALGSLITSLLLIPNHPTEYAVVCFCCGVVCFVNVVIVYQLKQYAQPILLNK